MKVVILCGGLGTRLTEETKIRPKPMVKIGRTPILLHLINYYANDGKSFCCNISFFKFEIKMFFVELLLGKQGQEDLDLEYTGNSAFWKIVSEKSIPNEATENLQSLKKYNLIQK